MVGICGLEKRARKEEAEMTFASKNLIFEDTKESPTENQMKIKSLLRSQCRTFSATDIY
jgi:hypothetical protein